MATSLRWYLLSLGRRLFETFRTCGLFIEGLAEFEGCWTLFCKTFYPRFFHLSPWFGSWRRRNFQNSQRLKSSKWGNVWKNFWESWLDHLLEVSQNWASWRLSRCRLLGSILNTHPREKLNLVRLWDIYKCQEGCWEKRLDKLLNVICITLLRNKTRWCYTVFII